MKTTMIVNMKEKRDSKLMLSEAKNAIDLIAEELSETDDYRRMIISPTYLDITIDRIMNGYEILNNLFSEESRPSVSNYSINPLVSCTISISPNGQSRKSLDVHILTLENQVISAVESALHKQDQYIFSDQGFMYELQKKTTL